MAVAVANIISNAELPTSPNEATDTKLPYNGNRKTLSIQLDPAVDGTAYITVNGTPPSATNWQYILNKSAGLLGLIWDRNPPPGKIRVVGSVAGMSLGGFDG